MLNSSMTTKILTGIDLGSTHVTAVIAQPPLTRDDEVREDSSHRLQILAATRVLNQGIRKGSLINFDSVIAAIQNAIDEVERQAGVDVHSARVSFSSTASVCENISESIPLKHNEVRPTDLERLEQAIASRKAAEGFDILNIVPAGFSLDGKGGLVNPIGMWGEELSALFHRVSAPQAEIRNIEKAVLAAGIQVDSLVFQPLAAAEGVLTSDEKEFGVCCLNLGHELAHVSVHFAGVPIFTRAYPIGAHHVTKDLAIGLRTTQTEAEQVKRNYGQALFNVEGASDQVAVATMDGRTHRMVTKGEIWHIIEPRVKEILDTIVQDLRAQKILQHLNRGVVLAGGGALLPGLCLATEQAFQLQARVGFPLGITGLLEGLRNPWTGTAAGLLSPLFEKSTLLTSKTESRSFRELARTIWGFVTEPFFS